MAADVTNAGSFFAGDGLIFATSFATAAGVMTDPTAFSIVYRDVKARVSAVTLHAGDMSHVSDGVYTKVIDTTDFLPGQWEAQSVATGTVEQVSVVQFTIVARPLG